MDETPRTIGYSKLNGMITSSYTIVKCFENVDPKFIFYVYLLIDNAKGLKSYYTGLRNSIRPETFMNIEISVPNFDIQKKIAKKLDSEMLNLDKVISLQKDKIDLLEQLKQTTVYESLINE
jgi:type I restriction enzyme S subunit